jgi:hypothetical protein
VAPAPAGGSFVVRHRTAAAALLLAGACIVGFSQTSGRPGRWISLSPREVKDSFFAYVIGIIREGVEVNIDAAGMREVLTEFRTSLDLPFDLIDRVWQRRETDAAEGALGLEFFGDATIPIPFSFLGYHPGWIRASQSVRFREMRFTYDEGRAAGERAPVYRLALEEGLLIVDMDQWLDDLFGDSIDDLPVRNLVFFTWRGEWVGLLHGLGYKGQPLRAFFNFRRNRIIFPIPAELDARGRSFVTEP